MADNALAMFSAGNLPAHVTNFFQDVGSNIPEKTSVPSLSYEGKIWAIHVDGTKNKLTYRNEDGDDVPVAVMRVVVLDCNARRGRAFYEGSYDPSKISAPRCWSDDGVSPGKAVKEPIASACANCPNSVKGSKVLDNGNATTACSQHRMLAVVPASKMDFTPLRLKIAITSDWDNQSPEMEAQGWFSFSKYLDFLKSRGLPHTAAIVTKMKFDQNAAFPKLFFSADRWLTEAEAAAIAPRIKSPEVQSLLDGSFTPAGVDGVPTETAYASAKTQVIEKPKEQPKAAVVEEEPEPDFSGIGSASDAVIEHEPVAEKTKPKAETKPAASNDVPDELASLLETWGK